MIMEKLYPITDLINPKDFARAFRDIIICHQWLVTTAKIMHCNISVDNLIGREGEKVFGVLNNFDLACWMNVQAESTSHQRTVSKTFVAIELLEPGARSPAAEASIHRVRFELESLLYVFAWIVCRYEDREEIATPPFSGWLSSSREDVSAEKFFWLQYTGFGKEPLTTTYQSLENVLIDLKFFIGRGHQYRQNFATSMILHKRHQKRSTVVLQPPQFDANTLGGHITYTKFLSAFDDLELD